MQAGEREPGLRFPARDRQHPHARQPGPVGGVGQQHGLAHAGLAEDEQDLARPRDRVYQGAQPGQAGVPADDGSGLLGGEFTGAWHLPVLSASALCQRRLQPEQRPRPQDARGAQSAVTRPIPRRQRPGQSRGVRGHPSRNQPRTQPW
jgi:hypothetical protein